MGAGLSERGRVAALDALARVEAARAQLWAREVALLVELAGAELTNEARFGVDGFLGLDLAGTCRYGQGTAAHRLAEADSLVHQLPQTLRWLGDGILMVHQAREILKITRNASPAATRELDRRLTVDCCSYSPADLRRKLGRLLLDVEASLDAEDAAQRRAAALRTRAVWLRPLPDGMAEVGCRLSAERAQQWAGEFEQLVRRARAHDRATGQVRTADQRRADVFADLPSRLLTCPTALATSRASGTEEAAGGSACGAPVDGSAAAGSPTGRSGAASSPAPSSPAQSSAAQSSAAQSSAAQSSAAQSSAVGPDSGAQTSPAAAADARSPVRPAEHGCGATGALSRVIINVHVPVTTLLELDSRSGYLDGYGAVSAEHIRLLLPTAGLRRVSVDAGTGRPLQVDSQVLPAAASPEALREQLLGLLGPRLAQDRAEPSHDPGAALARLVDLREAQCQGPGCARPATNCDRDHHDPWPAGPTAAWNLSLLSRRCHRAKHAGWTLARHPDGAVTWTSPQGRSYSKPSPWQPPPPVADQAQLRAPRSWQPPPPPLWEQQEPDEPLALPQPAQPEAVLPPGRGTGWSDEIRF